MATAKKKVTAKKTTTRKKASPKKTTVTKASQPSTTSEFWQVRFTINTVYWLIIGAAVIATAIITYNTNQQINDIYDRIELENAAIDSRIYN